ncbi:MerR family transcriptional regulator [Arenivirga flava]|uniref:HTH merR-type domain-containing protein n=1 Tax=Arenivirga flava TaxID=1930060 RepID=A0AA37XBG0_9MICO|nr:MerR family transcriptional regulator [Arenivirga flava]GMA28708.1 hypothetical protein GCM10025874_19610 [Arenivirga flava]
MSPPEQLHIGEVARMTGLSVGMLRNYEVEGLLRTQRDRQGDRLYGVADLARIEVIRALSLAGMPLLAIAAFLAPGGRDAGTEQAGRAALAEQVGALEVRLASITAALDALRGFL